MLDQVVGLMAMCQHYFQDAFGEKAHWFIDTLPLILSNLSKENKSFFSVHYNLLFGSMGGLNSEPQLGKYSTSWGTPLPSSAYFSDRVSCFLPGPASDLNPSTYISWIVGSQAHATVWWLRW
jgi:hypothetical protein